MPKRNDGFAVVLLLVVVIVIAVAGAAGWIFLGDDQGPQDLANLAASVQASEIVPAPQIDEKIKGYWSSYSGMILEDLEDAAAMRELGINTVTFSPSLTHTQEGEVNEQFGTEGMIKEAINQAHAAGFQVMLETTPMNAGKVDPKVTDVELFQSSMTKMAVKYATIAEEYDVAFFSPIVEPAHHMSVGEADEWMQEVLPELKAVYNGDVMWKKQAMHLSELRDLEMDHFLEMSFKLNNSDIQLRMKSSREGNITLDMSQGRATLQGNLNGETKFNQNKSINLSSSDWNLLKIEVQEPMIKIYLNNNLVFEYEDKVGFIGGYSLNSSGARINKFEVQDLAGDMIMQEDFKTLNNWSARSGWEVVDGEIIITSKADSGLIHDIDFSGFDYIAIDTFKRGKVTSNQEYVDYLNFIVDKTNDQAISDGVPNVIIAEFGGSIMEEIGWIDVDDRAKIPMTAVELAEVTQMVLEMAEEKVDGYMYNGWNIEGQGINQVPEIRQVISNWYRSH